MPKRYPEHFRLPTDGTLRDYKMGRELGLVDATHHVLRDGAEYVPIDDIRSRDVQAVIGGLRTLASGLIAAGRPLIGLSAVQQGHAARISLVPMPKELRDPEGPKIQFYPIINGKIENTSKRLGRFVAHGCASDNDVFTKLRVPETHTLTGYNEFGEPVSFAREGRDTAVDVHEVLWHENGLRAADIGMATNVQLDWRPLERKQEYYDFLEGVEGGPEGYFDNPNQPDWHLTYEYDQLRAVRAEEFSLADFLREQ